MSRSGVSEQHRRESELRLADSYLERARSLFRQGDDTAALLCLARTLQLAPPGDAGLDRAIRSHIGSFVGRLHQASLVLDPESQVGAVALSDDGETVACGKFDGVIVIWDTRTGNRAGELTGHRARIRALAISPDGRTLASGSDDGTAQFWNLATRRPRGDSIKFGSKVLAVAFSPDGRRAFTGDSDGRGRFWEVSTGEPIGEAISHPGGVYRGLYDPNGTVVLTYGGDECARLWDSTFGRQLPPAFKQLSSIRCAAFSSDNRYVLTGGFDRSARLCGTGKAVCKWAIRFAMEMLFEPSPSAQGATASRRRALMQLLASGPCPRASRLAIPSNISKRSVHWRSAPMARFWRPAAMIKRLDCGMWNPAKRLDRRSLIAARFGE